MLRINASYKRILQLPDSMEKFLLLERKMLSIKYHTTDPEYNKEYKRLYDLYNSERMKKWDPYLSGKK